MDKQTVGCNSPPVWLMSWLFCVICRAENSTIGCHLAIFSDDAFAHHTVVPHYPYPYKSACGIDYVTKCLSKMVKVALK